MLAGSADEAQKEKSKQFFKLNVYVGFSLVLLLLFTYFYFMVGKSRYPSDAFVDQQGSVYILDNSFGAVRKFKPNGEHIASFGGKGKDEGKFSGLLTELKTFTLDATGNVYLLNNVDNNIFKYDSSGKFLQKWNVPNAKNKILADGKAGIYVTLKEKPFIAKYSLNGQPLDWSLPSEVFTKSVQTATLDRQGNLFAISNGEVSKISPDGKLLARFKPQQTDNPRGLIVDEQGNIFILTIDSIQKYNNQNQFVSSWPWSEVKSYREGWLGTDSQNNIYNIRQIDNRVLVKKFDNNGSLLAKWTDGYPNWTPRMLMGLFYFFIFILPLFLQSLSRIKNLKTKSEPLPAWVTELKNSPNKAEDTLDKYNKPPVQTTSTPKYTFAEVVSMFLGVGLFAYVAITFFPAMTDNDYSDIVPGPAIAAGLLFLLLIFWFYSVKQKMSKAQLVTKNSVTPSESEIALAQAIGNLPPANNLLFNTTPSSNRIGSSSFSSMLLVLLFTPIILLSLLATPQREEDLPLWVLQNLFPFVLVGLITIGVLIKNLVNPNRLLTWTRRELFSFTLLLTSILTSFCLLSYLVGNFVEKISAGESGILLNLGVLIWFVLYICLFTMLLSGPYLWLNRPAKHGNYELALRRVNFLRAVFDNAVLRERQLTLLLQAGKFAEAEFLVQEYLVKLQNDKDNASHTAQGLAWLAEIRLAEERYTEAMFFYQKALELSGSDTSLYNQLAEVYLWANGNAQRALDLVERVPKPTKKSFYRVNLHANQAWALEKLGYYEEADAELTKAFRLAKRENQPEWAALNYKTARIMLVRGDTEKAATYLVRAELADPHGLSGQRAAIARPLLGREPFELC